MTYLQGRQILPQAAKSKIEKKENINFMTGNI